MMIKKYFHLPHHFTDPSFYIYHCVSVFLFLKNNFCFIKRKNEVFRSLSRSHSDHPSFPFHSFESQPISWFVTTFLIILILIIIVTLSSPHLTSTRDKLYILLKKNQSIFSIRSRVVWLNSLAQLLFACFCMPSFSVVERECFFLRNWI